MDKVANNPQETEREYILYFPDGSVRRAFGKLSEFQKLPVTRIEEVRKEEEFSTEVAKYLVEQRKPEITAKELEDIARKLEYEDIEGLINYIQSAEGRESFKKAIRLELWQAGYRPRGWEL